MKTLQCLSLSLLIFCASNTSLVTDDPSKQQERARELWEAAVAAKGGREKLQNIHSFYFESTFPGSSDRAYALFVLPDRSFHYVYWARFKQTSIVIYNGRRNITWWQVDSGQAHTIRDTEDDISRIREAQFTHLMLTRWLEPKPLRVRKEWIGLKRVDVVETDVEGWRVDYYLDPKTHLPIKVLFAQSKLSRAEGILDREVKLEDYREVDGIMMPHKLTTSLMGMYRYEERIRYELNVEYDEGIFEEPPRPGMRPDAWRRVVKRQETTK
jgi:hypothetical protein